jgi:hypothetical protein
MPEVARAGAGVGGVHQEADELPLHRGKFTQQGKHQAGRPRPAALFVVHGFSNWVGDSGICYLVLHV